MNALLVICGLGLVSLLAEIANLKKWLITVVMLGLISAAVLIAFDWDTSKSYYHNMVVFDNFSIAFTILIVIAGLLWFWMSADYFTDHTNITDRTALIVFAIAGAIIMVSFHNMAMLFLGIEILSVCLYVLAGSRKQSFLSNEAAFKYFLMGSFATGFLLMGIALVYGATGSFDIKIIGDYVINNTSGLPSFFYAGILLMFIGMSFKMSAVPFHFWAPDVYHGSPTVVTAFMATVVKIAAIGAFFRIFSVCFSAVQPTWIFFLQVICILTLIVANVTAVYQDNVKRMLAYSSVGHVGYILISFMAAGHLSAGTIYFYLTAYAAASLASFTVLNMLERTGEGTNVESFNGLFSRNSLLAVAMTISLLSLAGIPPLAGFFGKYMVFVVAVENGYVGVVVIAIITSLISVYYYFRIIIAMYFRDHAASSVINIALSHKVLLLLLVLMTLVIGVFPERLVTLLN